MEPDLPIDGDDGPAGTARYWVVRLASGDLAAGELEQLKAWLAQCEAHARAFQQERAFWHRLAALEGAFAESAGKTGLVSPGPAAPAPRVRPWRRIRATTAAPIAASLLLACIVLATWVLAPAPPDFRNGSDAVATVRLPDGSLAILNRNSSLQTGFDETARTVDLIEGDAYFEVRPDPARPFRVRAAGGTSVAVGTAFAVGKAGDRARVVVTEGRVAVTTGENGSATVALGPGEGVRYGPGLRLGDPQPVDATRALAWRDGRVVFVNRPLPEAVAELERYHPGRILLVTGGRDLKPVTGIIDVANLGDGLAALAASHGMSAYRITPFLTVLR